ncbi:MAG: beta-ketoacyl reductase [Gemmataceae bacterium]
MSPTGTHLIAGGLGDLGLLTAQWLAGRGARHFILVGRKPPSEKAREVVARLKELGARVLVAAADISVKAQLGSVLEQASGTLPPIRGVIHAAGELEDGVLLNQTSERFERVLAAKVAGSWNLHQQTRASTLDYFVVYSSAASLLGSPGQSNHAAANTFEDALAHYRHARGLPALSINWGVWSEIGAAVRRGVPDRNATRGMGTIDPRSGLQVLERLFGQRAAAQIGVLPADWPKFLRQGVVPAFLSRLTDSDRRNAPRAARERTGAFSARLRTHSPAERREALVNYVQQQVARVLGMETQNLPDRQKGFFDLGMDSLMSVELRNRLQAELGSDLGMVATTVFDYPTATALGYFLDEKLFHGPPTVPDQATEDAQAGSTLKSLSDDDLGEMLDERIDKILRE